MGPGADKMPTIGRQFHDVCTSQVTARDGPLRENRLDRVAAMRDPAKSDGGR
jgi:hypothetical protein